MRVLIVNVASILFATIVAFIQNLPVTFATKDYKFGNNYGLAIQTVDNKKDQNFDITYDVATKSPQYYQKFNDEAVVFWVGGPILNQEWKKLSKRYLWAFSKDWKSKTPKNKEVEGNTSVKMDLYYGVQNQWEGINLHKYFKKPLATSGVNNFGFETIFRPLNYGDAEFKKTYDSAEYEKKVAEMMKVQSQWMFQLGKDLKDLGYKKVHYLGFSFGSFLTNYFIKEYGDLAFKNIDTITSVGTRIKFDEEDVKVNVKQNKFPFKIYDDLTRKYDKTYLFDVEQNAATLGVILPIFRYLIKINYIDYFKVLSYENKKKLTFVSTPYDFRIGSLSDEEKSFRNYDLNIVEIPSHEMLNYQKNYLAKVERDIDENFKKSFLGGINHHDLLFKYYLHNFIELYNAEFPQDKLTRKKISYLCNISSEVIEDCEE